MRTDRHVSTTGAWRVVRGVVVGACASGIGALAHVAAGGAAPPPLLLLALALAVTAGCALASRWRWRLVSLSALMLLTQLGFHHLFTEYGGHGAGAMHTAHTSPWPSPSMLASHVAAALALALLLRYGDSWLRRVIEALGTLVSWLVPSGWSPAPRPQIVVPATDTVVTCHGPRTSVWSRGPPR